jgi:hypothetical protein
MPAWLIPTLKAVLPHLGTIVSAAVPAFTKKTTAETQNSPQQKQIAELQTAAAQNAKNIKELAEQLQVTITALEQAAVVAQFRHRSTLVLGMIAVLLSVAALGLTLFPELFLLPVT